MARHEQNNPRYQSKIDNEVNQSGILSSQTNQDVEPSIKVLIQRLLLQTQKPTEQNQKIINFFRAHDEFKEDQILRLQASLNTLKQKNKKLRNVQASAFSDKSELENLFLDCVDENRKDVLRHFTNSHAS